MSVEQVALLTFFETAHCEQVTRQFMAAEREALAAMLVVRTNTAREASRVATQEEATREAARAAEEAAAVAVQEEAACAAAWVEEPAEEAGADAAARVKMARDCRSWDEDMAAARRAREIHELASEHHHLGTWPMPVMPARPTMRTRIPSTPAGAMPSCRRRLQAKDGGTTTASRSRVV
jgi:hypothetical protein